MKLLYSNASTALPDLCGEVLRYGVDVPSRNGATKELTMLQVELAKPWPLEITSTDRNVSIAAQIAETMWVLSGRNDVDWLAHYLPQAPKFSDDGTTWRGGYGPRLRKWYVGEVPQQSGAYEIDQLQHVVDLLNEDPTTRRAVMSIYDPAIDTAPGKDIPCNNWLHFLARDGKLNLHVAIRSNDLMWGWSGINSFEWGALLTIVAGLTGLERGSLLFSISSLHLYERHFEKAERISKGRGSAPRFTTPNPDFHLQPHLKFDKLVERWFEIEAIIREGGEDRRGEAGALIGSFPEPMLRSWLQVLAGWWYGTMPAALSGTSLAYALSKAPRPKLTAAQVKPEPVQGGHLDEYVKAFIEESDTLHRAKDAAYGPSWYKRGEQMSIMANIARKVDRLGVDGGGDTSLDTAQDLMMYLAKYKTWLTSDRFAPVEEGIHHGPAHCDSVKFLLELTGWGNGFQFAYKHTVTGLETSIKEAFHGLEILVKEDKPRQDAVSLLLTRATALAYKLWEAERTQEEVPTEQQYLGNDVPNVPADERPVTDVDQWRSENSSRFFNGYNDPEGE